MVIAHRTCGQFHRLHVDWQAGVATMPCTHSYWYRWAHRRNAPRRSCRSEPQNRGAPTRRPSPQTDAKSATQRCAPRISPHSKSVIETLQAKVAFCSDTLPFFSNALDTIEVIASFNRQPARYRAVLRPQQRAHAVRSESDILPNLVLVVCH